MELIKDIYFNTDKLVENTKVKVSYTGKFYQEKNNKVYIHYGYGDNWNNINETEMIKTDLGYQTELDLLSDTTLNFCFKNQNNEWDNNLGKNYIFNIEKSTVSNLGSTTYGINNNPTNQQSSNIYWNSNNLNNNNTNNNLINNNNVVNNNSNNNPNSVDTFIKNIPNEPIKNDCIVGSKLTPNTVKTTSDTIKIVTPINNIQSISNNSTNSNKSSLAIINNNGFQKTIVWTKKLKTTVFNFFSQVPKFISGNFKKKIDTNQNINKQ